MGEAVGRLAVKLGRVVVPPHVRRADGKTVRVEGYTYRRLDAPDLPDGSYTVNTPTYKAAHHFDRIYGISPGTGDWIEGIPQHEFEFYLREQGFDPRTVNRRAMAEFLRQMEDDHNAMYIDDEDEY